jgi:hypothetical protein
VQRINLLWTNGRDVHHPMDEPNPAHVKSLGQGKARPISSSHPKVWRQNFAT